MSFSIPSERIWSSRSMKGWDSFSMALAIIRGACNIAAADLSLAGDLWCLPIHRLPVGVTQSDLSVTREACRR